jgi:hypothetical protein
MFILFFFLTAKAEAVARSKSRPKSEGGVQVAADSTEVAGADKQVKSEEAAVPINNQVRLFGNLFFTSGTMLKLE